MRKLHRLEKFLLISGIAFIGSLLTNNPLILTLTMTLFVIAVAVNMNSVLKGKNVIATVDEVTTNRAKEALENKKYGTAIVNTLALPAIIVGIIFVAIDIILMWTMVI